ncbi:hypothetical protein [Paenibacillus sp. GCM10012306]|uniref:hypothetical protein n=1 Tax=Paenibacillus sp. GCM10012306 TaxID=3317342 RepID=UPI003606FCFE
MDKLIVDLNSLTQDIMNRLYDLAYEEIEEFVEERQKLVDSLVFEVERGKPTSAQKLEITRILEHDPEIMARMNALRLEAQDWLYKRNQAKAQRSAYEAAYTPDSFLMDRKK